ncbi:MAG TPA: aminotransferase class V-fold PLP-dependent enzyme [Ohtaekwangia sp.]
MSQRTVHVTMRGEEFRKTGHDLIDRIAHHLDTLGERPVTTGETARELHDLLGADSLPQTGSDAEIILKRAANLLFDHSLFNGHPKFLGYITSSASPLGALSDLLAAAVNPNVGAFILSPMATTIEKQTIRWLAEFIGVSPEYGGILVSGGNMANFTAFLAARTAKAPTSIKQKGMTAGDAPLIVYCSKATHAWIEKAAVFFGIGTDNIRWIAQDESLLMRTDLLEQTIITDLNTGRKPFLVIGNAGDVSTGAVDDLKAIASVCKKYDLWFHVDGAYGIPAAVLPELKSHFEGIAEADSIALDPHKWLYSPLEAGCTLVKYPQTLLNTYNTHPEYYNFSQEGSHAINYYEYGFQNSRGFRALKVWTALQHAGRDGYRAMIAENIRLSMLLFQLAADHAELEAVTQHLSITTLRYTPPDTRDETYLNRLNEALLNTLQQNGEVFLSNAIVHGKYCLRACIVNFRTTEKDIAEIIYIIVREGRKIHKEMNSTDRQIAD